MSLIIYFVIFVILLSLILLMINLIFGPHKPYGEKKTPFECGYVSFLSQSRIPFTVSHYLFAILFLMFDIEIIVTYPFTVSSYFTEGHGYIIIVVFILLLSLAFIFEVGKNALTINTNKQYNFISK